MPRKPQQPSSPADPVRGYRHPDATRKNIPPAGLAAQGNIQKAPKQKYDYNPHLPPVLRFDGNGTADRLPELIREAGTRPLTADEQKLLAEALRNREPWLEWSGKREKKAFEVDPVALHIHERVSTQAILKIAAREDVKRSLFADPELEYREAVKFYQYDVDWSNRMILGDSLQVMASLARREDMAGKVQMIYMDPPYGIKFASNFQPEIGVREVTDREKDLTREPEMVRAYRDTWTLGVHSYLSYLRDRLILCRELLADTGSLFLQIGDENQHRVRALLEEVFGADNYVITIILKKKGATTPTDPVNDYILWFAKDRERCVVNRLYYKRTTPEDDPKFNTLISPDGEHRRVKDLDESTVNALCAEGWKWARVNYPIVSQHPHPERSKDFETFGRLFRCGRNCQWRFDPDVKLRRIAKAERLFDGGGESLGGIVYWDDWSYVARSNIWDDAHGEQGGLYVYQTGRRVIERCILMTTKPGDLVLDPTCGGGTTAYLAEQWGRRWITIDTSRVAIALSRQRLLTAHFPYYITRDDAGANPGSGFVYKTASQVTLKSIANNVALDSILSKHDKVLRELLLQLNTALRAVPVETRHILAAKLSQKERRDGKRAITESDRRRWLLPKDEWRDWEVPHEQDEDWTPDLKSAFNDYHSAWRKKMAEVNASIQANAEQKDLFDDPQVERSTVRVAGPFSLEAVIPVEEGLETESPIGGAPDEMGTYASDQRTEDLTTDPVNAEAYLDKMLRLLRADGVRFPNNRVAAFSRLEFCPGEYLHAEGEWDMGNGQKRLVAVSFGPEFGPVTAYQVENALPAASRQGYEDLVFAGFSFDAAAQAVIQDDPNPRVRCHLAHIRPDLNMGDLLKETPNSQLFTVFGSPRTELIPAEAGLYRIKLEGMDIYNPVDNTLLPTNADKVAAWFIDTDYDGHCFCVAQAFFPDKTAWDKLARALKGVIDEEKFTALSGKTSLPFPSGKHKRAAVKVIDPRGNEVMRVHRLSGE